MGFEVNKASKSASPWHLSMADFRVSQYTLVFNACAMALKSCSSFRIVKWYSSSFFCTFNNFFFANRIGPDSHKNKRVNWIIRVSLSVTYPTTISVFVLACFISVRFERNIHELSPVFSFCNGWLKTIFWESSAQADTTSGCGGKVYYRGLE